jgi:multidrug efflux pump subunit AcrB
MRTIISFAVRHPVSIVSSLIAVILLGILSMAIIPVDFLPVLSSRILLVAAEYEGISAGEMRSLVTIPLEDAFASLKGLKTSSSVTRDGLSLLSVELHWGTDIDIALTESREIIDICYETLPSGCSKPVASKNDSSKIETLSIALIPRDGDLQYCRYLADNDIKSRFQRLAGVATVTVTGGEKEELQVQVHRDLLEGRQLSLQTVADILSGANFEFPAGTIREGERELSVKTSGLFTSITEIGNTPLLFNNGSFLRISDIADTVRTTKRKETFFLYNNLECIKIGIQKKGDASPLQVSVMTKQELATLEQLYGSWCRFEIIDDISNEIKKSLFSLFLAASIGIMATGSFLYIFMRSLKFSFLVASIIPLSALVSAAVLLVTGKTLNLMSLSGMAIGIGLVVDAGTVAIENIQKELSKQNSTPLSEVVINSTFAVINSNIGMALTTIVVFVPVFFVSGLLGELFADMAIAVIASIFSSCILSLTYIPSMCMLIGPLSPKKTRPGNFIQRAEKKYISILNTVLNRHWYIWVIFGIGCFIGVVSFLLIDYRMLPRLSSKTVNGEISFAPGTILSKMQSDAVYITRQLLNEPYIESVKISGGLEHNDYPILAIPEEHPEKLRITLSLSIPSEEAIPKIHQMFEGSANPISLFGHGDILSRLLELQDHITILRGDTPEIVHNQVIEINDPDVTIIPNITLTESVFTPDRLAAARFAVSAQYMAAVARNTLEGIYTLSYYEDGREIPILVKFRDNDVNSLASLENTLVQLENTYVPLRILGSISSKDNEKVLYRYNRKDAKQLLNFIPANDNRLEIVSPGKIELTELAHNALFLIVITIILLYLILGAQFESFLLPLILLVALPPAFSGAFFALLVSGNSLNINSIVALIILFGISINNSILLYETYVQQQIKNKETLVKSCAQKLRAILITNVTTIVALLPFAIDPFHYNAQSSLAAAIIGGLVFSAIIILTILPSVFLFTLSRQGTKK